MNESGMETFVESEPLRREHVRALLIDDDPEDAEIFRRLLAKSKHLDVDLAAFATVAEARAALTSRRFDIVYVDYWLGLDTSIGFVHEFARANDVPSVMLTGLDVPDVRRLAFRAGVEAFLSKEQLSTQAIDSVTLAVLRHHATL
ncbi:MAG: response regulator [Roseiarcus sp.]